MIGPEHIYPHPEREAYPAMAGPGTYYPAEAPREPGMVETLLPGVAVAAADMAAAVKASDWPAYFEARRRWAEAENAQEGAAPPPEHTTRDPWPEGFAAPTGAHRAKKAAEAAGCQTAMLYMRRWRKGVGRGVYVLTHYVTLAMAKDGHLAWARWRAPAVEGKLAWTFDCGNVDGWPADTLKQVTAKLTPAEVSGS